MPPQVRQLVMLHYLRRHNASRIPGNEQRGESRAQRGRDVQGHAQRFFEPVVRLLVAAHEAIAVRGEAVQADVRVAGKIRAKNIHEEKHEGECLKSE